MHKDILMEGERWMEALPTHSLSTLSSDMRLQCSLRLCSSRRLCSSDSLGKKSF